MMPEPHVFVPSVPVTLNVPSEGPGSESVGVHCGRAVTTTERQVPRKTGASLTIALLSEGGLSR